MERSAFWRWCKIAGTIISIAAAVINYSAPVLALADKRQMATPVEVSCVSWINFVAFGLRASNPQFYGELIIRQTRIGRIGVVGIARAPALPKR
jgi:hypothetical protein